MVAQIASCVHSWSGSSNSRNLSEIKFGQSKVAEIPGQIRKEQETLLDIERDERERENVRARAEHGIGAAEPERPLSDSELSACIQ